MQDACPASYNALKNVNLDATALMCYFHVVSNIKKRYSKALGSTGWFELHGYIEKIHLSRSISEKKKQIQLFTDRYKVDEQLDDDLYEYVNKQWLEGAFNKWQIYHNEPGWANTNSNIESFNAAIKRDFFKRRRMTVIGAVHKIEEIIKYYSTNKKEFHILPKYSDKLDKFSLSKTLKDIKVIEKLSVSIKSTVTNAKYIIKLKDKSCSCCFWLKKNLCP